MPKRAPFILIEGLDRSGKSTQAALLLARMEEAGNPTKLLKFPDRTTAIGKMIDAYLQSKTDLDDRAIHLLFSANRWALASSIEHLLSTGTAVLCDRYAFSGIAFSASTGLPYEWCRAPDIGLPAPDLTLFFEITPEAAKARGGYGEERYEKEEMQRRVAEVFHRIGKEVGGGQGRWVNVDAGRERAVVQEEVWGLVQELLGTMEGPLQRLWTDKIPQ